MKIFKGISLLFIAILFFSGLFLYWLWQDYQERLSSVLDLEQSQVQNQYSSTINSYRLVSKTLYDEVLNSPEILQWLDAAATADAGGQAIIRHELYNKLLPVFERLKKKNFKQVNFYLPDTTSFLNMQRPDYFGDQLGEIRPSVKMVSEEHKYVEGFEEGKAFNGFMFVFPLFAGERYLGSVETSVSFNTFRHEMSMIFPFAYNFLIKKNVLTDQIFADEARNYFLSDLNRDYFYEKENDSIKRVDIVLPEQVSKINTLLKDGAYPVMSGGGLFTKTVQMDKMNFLVTFVPIKNIKGNQVAYLVAYHRDDAAAILTNDFIIKLVFVLALAAAMLAFVYYIHDSQQRLLATGEKLKNITAAMGEGLLVINPDERVIFFNEAAAKISGYGAAEVLNREYWRTLKFVPESGETRHDQFIKYVLQYNDFKSDSRNVYLKRQDGLRLPVAISAAPLRSSKDKAIGCIVVFRDITQERLVDKAKTEFVSLASHQLKTPLSAVNWYAEMLLDEEAGKLNDQQKDFLHEIQAGNERMIKLINGLLNVSRIDMGTLSISPEPVDLAKEMDSVLGELQFGVKAKGLEIIKRYDKTLPKISLDLNLTRVVLQNLLSNAVKYSREHGQIELTIKKANAKEALISVRDNGYGIPRAEQPSIFKKLFRADNVKSKKVEGTGLGLYVAKAVVEAFGGKIWFESPARQSPDLPARASQWQAGGSSRMAGGEENKGTTFSFTVPLKGAKPKVGTKDLESNA